MQWDTKIREKEAHYLLAVRENQKELHQNIIQSFDRQSANDSNTHVDTGHGRIEKRTCDIITSLDWIETKPLWKDLNTTSNPLLHLQQESRCRNL